MRARDPAISESSWPVWQGGEDRMGRGVGAYFHASGGDAARLLPVHRRELALRLRGNGNVQGGGQGLDQGAEPVPGQAFGSFLQFGGGAAACAGIGQFEFEGLAGVARRCERGRAGNGRRRI